MLLAPLKRKLSRELKQVVGRERQAKRKGGTPLNARTVLKLLANPKVRGVAIRLLKSPTVRRIILKQIQRRLFHK